MKHLTMGTAGHIDHGKTALIKALTNIDCDTHKEEKKRGITINLGFSYLKISGKESLGIIDVPGHKDFIHTMVGGASGIDFVLFIIAADSGVMPQTHEHLNILQTLGIKKGIIVLTKIDLADEDLIGLSKNEIGPLVKNTFLENAPIVEVSSITGQGIENLKNTIAQTASGIEQKEIGNIFRMYIDRIFSVKGFGSVVTGTVLNGEIKTSKEVYLLPDSKKALRVRRIEKHAEETNKAIAGDRAAINVVGLERNDFERGMIISDTNLQETKLIDASLFLFKKASELKLWTNVIFLSGTFETQAKIHLINKDKLKGGENAAVQIHLDKACVLFHRDKFVIRNTSGDHTLGGGEIIDASPLHHRRRPLKLVESITRLAQGNLTELIKVEVKKALLPTNAETIARKINRTVPEIIDICKKNKITDVELYQTENSLVLVEEKTDKKFYTRAIANIKAYHRNNPLLSMGLTSNELKGKFGLTGEIGEGYINLLLNKINQQGVIKKYENTWVLADHKINISEKEREQIEWLESILLKYDMQTPLMSEMEVAAYRRKINKNQLKQYLSHLKTKKKVFCIDNNYIHSAIVNRCRKKLLKELSSNDKGFTVSQFRDLIKGNRKICLLLLSNYDNEGITARKDELRFITDKGRKLIRN